MAIDFNGRWKNQLGSLLELRAANGVVEGRFESGVGDEGQTLYVDIKGQFLDDVITFSAVYPRYGTVITWAGQVINKSGVDEIRTQWLHVTNVQDNQEQDWMWFTNRIGADVFTRVA